jgi:hypothetical protein
MTDELEPSPPRPVLMDATKRMMIKLQPADAVGARRSDPSACIIARAIMRSRGVVDVRVGAEIARIEYKDRVVRYVLSRNDRALIAGFDGGLDAFAAGYVVTLDPPPRIGRYASRAGTGIKGTDRRSGNHDGVVRRRPSSRHINVVPEHEAAT